ncbi:hypothetical protein [Mesorhizobium sp. L103C105A0]|uniref:hypothetical protein n=1 Tax=Mesorhizobium sp. L103C105A0 TaxID=1287074 RepID=UPI0003CFFB8D|nr:hypothetical protein [Mesorhizobium sp. L103C105A0]ESZ76511.1 hypothetical protein X726_14345 [Mesorhizobium sp. L103C105A0]
MTCVTWPSKADGDATLQAREQLSPPHTHSPRFHREYGGNVALRRIGSAGGSKKKRPVLFGTGLLTETCLRPRFFRRNCYSMAR